jgi:hypothetical protein
MMTIFTILSYVIPDFQRFIFRFVRTVQWLLLSVFYVCVGGYILASLGLVRAFGGGAGVAIIPVLPLGAILIFAIFAYERDKQREALGLDDFSNDWLFFRYGEMIDYSTLTIPVKDNWGFKETEVSAQTLRTTLAERIAERMPFENLQIMARKLITDRHSGEQKEFTRILIQSKYGSSVTVFIHYAAFGQTITAHHFTHRRGTYDTWAVVRFVLSSPFTIWFWGLGWLVNKDSILARISEFRSSSFDGIDLHTMHAVAHRVIYGETRALLKEADLLNEELTQQINNQIINFSGSVQGTFLNGSVVGGSVHQTMNQGASRLLPQIAAQAARR